MGARIPVLAAWLAAAFIGCRRPPVEQPEPRPPPPSIARIEPPPALAPPPSSLRFITPENPDRPPQPPVITRGTGRAARQDLGDGWTAKLEPADIAAAPGDQIEFSLDLRDIRSGSGRPELGSSRAIRWLDPKQTDREDPAEWLPLQGGRARGVLLASPDEWSQGRDIHLQFRQRQRPGSLGHARIDGPRLDLDTTTIVPVQVRRITGRCDLPDGLAVTVEGRRVTAYFSKPMGSDDDIRTRGDVVVRRISGRPTLVGFVDVYYSDVGLGSRQAGCPHLKSVHPFTRNPSMSAIEAQFTAPEPGPIRQGHRALPEPVTHLCGVLQQIRRCLVLRITVGIQLRELRGIDEARERLVAEDEPQQAGLGQRVLWAVDDDPLIVLRRRTPQAGGREALRRVDERLRVVLIRRRAGRSRIRSLLRVHASRRRDSQHREQHEATGRGHAPTMVAPPRPHLNLDLAPRAPGVGMGSESQAEPTCPFGQAMELPDMVHRHEC